LPFHLCCLVYVNMAFVTSYEEDFINDGLVMFSVFL
jgi:hypothetical protein